MLRSFTTVASIIVHDSIVVNSFINSFGSVGIKMRQPSIKRIKPIAKRVDNNRIMDNGGSNICEGPNITFNRYLLFSRKQKKGESVEQFHGNLKEISNGMLE